MRAIGQSTLQHATVHYNLWSFFCFFGEFIIERVCETLLWERANDFKICAVLHDEKLLHNKKKIPEQVKISVFSCARCTPRRSTNPHAALRHSFLHFFFAFFAFHILKFLVAFPPHLLSAIFGLFFSQAAPSGSHAESVSQFLQPETGGEERAGQPLPLTRSAWRAS